MKTIQARNVNTAFPKLVMTLASDGMKEESRSGPVVSIPTPVCIEYLRPEERILWNEYRDANPFFHLMEALWMLAGRKEVAYPEVFNSRMREYAEEGGDIHGAYGNRWRHHFSTDQVRDLIQILSRNSADRRAVLSMWDPFEDGNKPHLKDVPCNTHAYFRVVQGRLDMTVLNRSNDFLWGAMGANVVHFSMLQEFLARALGRDVGSYYQISNNMHAYLQNDMVLDFFQQTHLCYSTDYYSAESTSFVRPYPLFEKPEQWKQFRVELEPFMVRNYSLLTMPFLLHVAMPMQEYYYARKAGAPQRHILENMRDCDWKLAALQWHDRREARATGLATPHIPACKRGS